LLTLTRLFRHLLPLLLPILLLLAASPVRAGLPDATRFTVVMELGDLSQAKEWLDEGLPPGFLGDRIGTGLMIGAWDGNIPMMELFLARGADINQTNSLGEQALQLAAWRGHTEAVAWLLDHGAAVNREGKQWSALHYAAFAGHDDLLKLLLSRGGDVNAQTPNQSTVLMMAAHEGHEDAVQELLKAGADPRPKNDWGDTALTWAMRYHNLKIAKLISSAAEFAEAVKAPPESFGKPVRSVPAPMEISEILRQIRIARAEGKPVDDLQQTLFATADKLKAEVVAPREKRAPKALLITARKPGSGQQEGERAELSYGTQDTRPSGKSGASGTSDVSDILARLRRAQAEGKPVEELRQALLDAVARRTK
jgi:hypothetical protein